MANTTVLEHCEISPAFVSKPEFSLPLTFFDMIWYDFPATQSVLFFKLPASSSSKTHFLNTIVPDLKRSLSITLSHFLPLAGNIIHPLTPSNQPVLRYEAGDSVSFTICESNRSILDFNHLTGDSPRSCDEFYAFSPRLPPASRSVSKIRCPVLALQVTLLPGQGICVGIVSHHAATDASSVASFLQSWALINSTIVGNDGGYNMISSTNCLIESKLMPYYNRKTVGNLGGLDSIYWDSILTSSASIEPPPVKLPFDKFRSTFILKSEEIQKLKDIVMEKCPGVARLSSFTVICSLVWVCLAKSAAHGGEEVAEDETEYLSFSADCRRRLNPPLPGNYFGNCVSIMKAEMKHGELKSEDGFVKATDCIGKVIEENVFNDEKGALHGAEYWRDDYRKLAGKRQHGVVGSPRFDFYSVDYGWGNPSKFEAIFIDNGGAFSLCRSRNFEGGIEIGLSKPKLQMDAFATIFPHLLHSLIRNF